MNTVLETIRTRRSVRKFQPGQIDEKSLSLILEAGRYAPSGGNNQLSHLLVLQNPKVLEELTALVEAAFQAMEVDENAYKSLKHSVAAAKKGGYHFTYSAPTLVVVANQRGYGNAMADSACVLENMMLAAASLDIGSCWINQLHWLDETPSVREYMISLGLGENETICGALALGYSAIGELRPLERTGNHVTYVR